MYNERAPAVNEDALKSVIVELKLSINQKLYQKGLLTDEMYTRAKELILKKESA